MSVGSGTRGMTLVELLIGMVVTAIVAGGLLRMVLSDARFAEDREAWRTARQVSRSALVVLNADLRMLETGGGLEAAAGNGQSLTARVPYTFGVLCQTTGSVSTVSLLPADSVMFAQPGYSGFAYRDESAGTYTYVAGGTLATAPSTSCTAAQIAVLPGGRVVSVSGTVPAGLVPGAIVLLYRRVRYEVKSSVLLPGQMALWRTALTTGGTEEIAVPLESAARFRYFVDPAGAAMDAPPSPLSLVVGLELGFTGQSDRTPRGAAGPKTVPLRTAIFFRNQP